MNQESSKRLLADTALDFVTQDCVLGVGTGSTVDYFIEALARVKNKLTHTVASSERTARRLLSLCIPVVEFNDVDRIDVYIDGADEVDPHLRMIKGRGAALTREKILGYAAKQFVCIADSTKFVDLLGAVPVPIEVIPMARSAVARQLTALGGRPEYRIGVMTDNGNVILDTYGLNMQDVNLLEQQLNNIPGVVSHGLFAVRPADVLLLGYPSRVERRTKPAV